MSARKLFNSVSEADVRYDAVDSYESLLELVRGLAFGDESAGSRKTALMIQGRAA